MKTPTHEQVAQRAHDLWLNGGCPEGRDREFWLEAEHQLRNEAHSAQPQTANGEKNSGGTSGAKSNPESTTQDRLIGEMASESAIENHLSPAPSDQEAIRAALQKKEARAPQMPHKSAPKAKPPESGKPVWPKPHSS